MTAETAGTTGEAGRRGTAGDADAATHSARGDGAGHVEQGDRWAPGTRILWRYRANGAGHPHICRPVTVVCDTPDLLAAWVEPGTICVKPEMADGTPVHHEPLETRYTKPRRTVLSRWFGTGVLKLARPGEAWSVWLFWERDWRFKNWYVNLEEPRRRWAGGIDSEDHFLDIAVYPDRSWEWRDEDEFAAAQHAGLVDEELAARVRTAGQTVIEQIRAWEAPFGDGWENWRPDPHWPVPRLPLDWDGWPEPGAPAGTAGSNGAPPAGDIGVPASVAWTGSGSGGGEACP
ncbi:MAG TPA: DUF402 domain-containing protein [Streptomyces sp.]|jgi:hypothetical protein|nr:DUF402 domain-containing protein [Streptomyces sp.]